MTAAALLQRLLGISVEESPTENNDTDTASSVGGAVELPPLMEDDKIKQQFELFDRLHEERQRAKRLLARVTEKAVASAGGTKP